MSRFGEAKSGGTAGAKCCICGDASGVFAAWEHPLCGVHWSAWVAEPSTGQAAINASLKRSEKPEDYLAEEHALYVAEGTRRTSAWVTAQAKARAA